MYIHILFITLFNWYCTINIEVTKSRILGKCCIRSELSNKFPYIDSCIKNLKEAAQEQL